jgi:hypothetical protein
MSLLDQPACAMATIDLRVAEARFQGAADALSTLLANIGDDIVAAGIIKQIDECYHNQAIYTRELRRRAEGKPSSQPTCGIEADYVYFEDYYDDTEGKPCSGKGKDTAYPGKRQKQWQRRGLLQKQQQRHRQRQRQEQGHV